MTNNEDKLSVDTFEKIDNINQKSLDRLDAHNEKVYKAIAEVEKANEKLKAVETQLASQKKYVWLKWSKTWASILSPTILLIMFILLSKYAPCGINQEFGGIKIVTAPCIFACPATP